MMMIHTETTYYHFSHCTTNPPDVLTQCH